MSANNFNLKCESYTEVPAMSEHYTYYPTWFNGSKTTTPVVGSKSYTNMVEELQQESGKYGIQRPQEDIVIAGVSGKFPESDNVEEFAQNLYNGVDMVNEGERRWPSGLYGLPKRMGTIKDITRFDAQFFGIHPKQVDNMDPQLRMLLEVAYESLFDAGVNPAEMKGTRTGVFIGASGSDAQQAFSADPESLSGYSMTGCATSMLANRLSYFFDFKGPSVVIDTACSSSLVAMDAAITALKTGQCDFAIVGGVNLLARPQTSLQFQKLGMLSQEGKCKSFDAQGKGYVRSETVGAIFLQKKDITCKRFYAKVLHSKVNTDGAKEQGITYPSGRIQSQLLREIYAESDIDPSLVTYVEAHGTGTKVGDPQELNSIAEVFASQQSLRNVPLFIGSTKSNMGHSEPASGIAALIKMLISIQRGIIPANLHYQEPNAEVAALRDGRLKVVDVNTKFRGGLMALNSFGFGGANAHVLIQPNADYMLKSTSLWNQDLTEITQQPRLFPFCSRTQQGLEEVFTHMQANTADLAKQVLLQSNSRASPATHPFRGFTILNGQKSEMTREIRECTGEKKPIWFIFSGMGTQYQGMGVELMKIDIFRQSIIRSAETLKPYGINLIDIIYAKHNVYERTLNAFVGIAAIQIALVDCLRAAGVEADGILGHSVGELGCAYADNCFTAEETLLAAYYRGKCIEDAQLPQGAMAAVGMTWAECQRRCPAGVVPACHNSVDTVTISGPKKCVAEFVQQLKSEGIFAKEVESSNVAFHSYYMTSIAPTLKMALEKVIPTPKLRSNKWISTSMPEQRWETELARYSSPDYHVNNLCSPVLFQEAIKFIPTNAVVIEIAPHALLQAILKRSLPTQATLIPLMKKEVPSHMEHFLTQLGRVYMEGVNVDTVKLMLPFGAEHIMYPVPVGTGFVSHLAKWDHEQKWNTPKYEDFLVGKQTTGVANMTKYTIDLQSEKDAFLAGHMIDGRVIYPATGYVYLVWKTLAKLHGFTDVEQLPVTFQNVEIHQATILATKEQLKTQQTKKITFTVSISPATGFFEVIECGNVVCTGTCFTPETQTEEFLTKKFNWTDRTTFESLEQPEIYKELSLRGYEYNGEFQPIVKCDIEGYNGDLVFAGKWISFLDGMLQMNVLSQKRGLLLPTRIRTITIDPRFHAQAQKTFFTEEYNTKYFTKYGRKTAQFDKFEKIEKPFEQFEQKQFEQKMFERQMFEKKQFEQKQFEQKMLEKQQFEQKNYEQISFEQFEQKMFEKQQFEQKQFEQKQFEQKMFEQKQFEQKMFEQKNFEQFEQKTFEQTPFAIMPITFDQFTGTTVCGGVEITGLHATCAPRRHLAQPTILERVNFVPYVEKQFDDEFTMIEQCTCNGQRREQCLSCDYVPVQASISEKRECLEYYLEECKRHTVHILRKIEFPTTVQQTIQSLTVPKQWQQKFEQKQFEQKFETLTIQTPTMTGVPSTVEFLQGGKLLQLLKEIANVDSTDGQYFYKVQKCFNEKFAYWKALEEDRVLNYLNKRSTYLKSFLDTVLENTQFAEYKQQNKLKVLEISPSMGQFFGVKINKFLKTHPQLNQMDYHYVPTQFGAEYTNQPEEMWSELNRQLPCPIQKHEWNMCINNGRLSSAEPPKHLKDFDLVIFNGSLSTLLPYCDNEFEIKQWLQTVVEKVMKPEGFLFVHEFTNNFETLNCLNQLEQIVFRQQKQMVNGKFTTYPTQKYQSEQQWRMLIEDAGFSPVALKCDTVLSTMFLYRIPSVYQTRPINALGEEKIFIDDVEQYNWIEQVKTAMFNKQTQRVWLISEKSPNSGIVGLVNCLRKEIGGEKIRCIFVADKQPICLTGYLVPSIKSEKCKLTQTVQWTHLFEQLRRADMVMNVFRNGQWGSFRHMLNPTTMEELVMGGDFTQQYMPTHESQLRNAYINMQSRGDLSSLQWMQSPEPFIRDAKKQVHCQVSYAALNFRDIMLATGKLTPEAIPGYYKMQDGLLGMEFSGKDSKQQRWMGMVPAKGLATSVVVDQKYLFEVPTEWTLKQAATVPVAYSTAYYALIVRGQLKQGETVLIHAGSGAVGQACIAIALSYKCKVFITVSSDEKREYLKALFPGQLCDSQFANSRDIFFEKHIMQMTRGAGVDVVVNSLSGDKLQASIRVLAQHGRFLEIGKFDLNKNSQLGMSAFLKNITFHGILVDSLFEGDNAEWARIYQLVQEGIRSGVVRPLSSTVFEKNQIEEAFRFMAQGKHMGKVIVKIFDHQLKDMNEKETNYITGFPKVWFSPLKTYIVTGGLGGFGLELTQWMVERGARHMILTSRSGLKTGYQAKKIRNLQEEFGASIKIAPFDVKEEQDCRALFAEAKKCPEGKIGGIFHLAAIVDDGLFESQTAERFRTVGEVKAKGAYNLDMFSRTEGIMDDSAFFVVFSSVTSGRGNMGQTNYGFANSSMERICEYRRRDGKHALAIQWGAIGDVGLIVESTFGGSNESIVGGTMPQRIQSCLKTLELLLLKSAEPKDTAVWSSFVPAERTYTNQYVQQQQQPKSIVELVANILGLKDIKQWRNEQITLGELGLDSLMNVEIKQILEQLYNLPLAIREIQQLTIEKLRIIERTKTSPIATEYLPREQMNQYTQKKVSYLMPTKTVEKLNIIEFMPNQKHIPVVVIHPIEGHVNMLKSWAKHMKYPVFGVQYTHEAMRHESIEQLADFYWQQIEQELAKHGKNQLVHLCGYSFGASVAFEMAAKRSQRIASLTFLDGSHLFVNAHINTYKNKYQLESMHETEAEALCTFVQQYTQVHARKQLIEEMLQMPSFDQKIRFVVRELIAKSQFTFEPIDLEQAARSYVSKIFMSNKYQPKQVLRMKEALLIKSGQRTNLVQALGEDYGLGQVIAGKVQIETVHGDHRSFLDAESGFQVASLMNEFLLRCF